MFLYTHRHGNRHCSFIISYCWGGVGWGQNVHVPVRTHTQARQQALLFHHHLLLGWGGDDDDDDEEEEEDDEEEEEVSDDVLAM